MFQVTVVIRYNDECQTVNRVFHMIPISQLLEQLSRPTLLIMTKRIGLPLHSYSVSLRNNFGRFFVILEFPKQFSDFSIIIIKENIMYLTEVLYKKIDISNLQMIIDLVDRYVFTVVHFYGN